jgi:O-acetylserine/cysteine efflux transporter
MPINHVLLAIGVVFIWGTNFVVIRWALEGMPPFALATLRFALSALPLVFFIKRPAVRLGKLAAFGVLLGVGQFGLLYFAIGDARHTLISPGLASLVIQTQVFFTIALSMLMMRERIQGYQGIALAMCVAGIAVIAAHVDATLTVLGLGIILSAAFFWACANLVAKSAGKVNMLAFMVWSSLFAVPPLLLLSLWLEGAARVADSLTHMSTLVMASTLWQAWGNSLVGYSVWNWLLTRHPAATVTPLALLVPVFGMSASAWMLNEPLQGWKLWAAALVLTGLAMNVFWPTLKGLLFVQKKSA